MSEPSAGMMVTSNVRLLRPLGEGGMGAVWVAEHQSLRTQVVVKFMARDLAQSGEALARFSREAAAASQVKSPHVVQMLDHGVLDSGAPYIVMELLEGRDLEQQIRASGVLEPREVAAILVQLARALGKAHERGIVHRDIKPSNVFLCDAGGGELFVKLLDFGIAKGPEGGIVGNTTRTGSFIGSPYYMSPEQVVGAKTIDFRTDLWSLGVVAFEALTGQRPFFAETVGALALKIHRDPLPVPSKVRRSLPRAVDAWFARACAREPDERFGSAKETADALAVAVTGQSSSSALHVDRIPAPRPFAGLEPTQPLSPAASTDPSIADARSETGSGVGLAASERLPMASRSRWVALGAIASVAVAVGFVVPKMIARSEPPPPVAAAATPPPTLAPAPALSVAPPLSLAPPPEPTLAPAPAPAPVVVPAPVAARAPAPSHPHASAPASTRPAPPPPPPSATAAPPATATRPPPGSDDDIK